MNKKLIKSVCIGVIWSAVALAIATVLQKYTSLIFNDTIFVEGIIMVILAAFSAMSGNSTGLSLQGLGSSNGQYVASANLEITKMERDITERSVKNTLKFSLSSFCLLIGGIITLVLNFLL